MRTLSRGKMHLKLDARRRAFDRWGERYVSMGSESDGMGNDGILTFPCLLNQGELAQGKGNRMFRGEEVLG
jgi:hypothetical protein